MAREQHAPEGMTEAPTITACDTCGEVVPDQQALQEHQKECRPPAGEAAAETQCGEYGLGCSCG